MGFLDKILKGFLGDKNEKDVKELRKYVDDVLNAEKEKIEQLSLDGLRAKTTEFKEKIQEATKDQNNEIADLRSKLERVEEIEEKDDIFAKIDALNKEKYEIEEKVLADLLPEAFAVVKETAKRFYNNTELEVTATPFDRELAGTKDYVTINGDTK